MHLMSQTVMEERCPEVLNRQIVYNKIRKEIIQLVLHEKYRISSIDGSIYICHTCHAALKLGKIPAQSKANRMALD